MGGGLITESEALSFVKAIEAGEILLSPKQEPQEVYAGNVSYAASNGWFITIFNDANEWDYIDTIQSSDGRVLDFDAIAKIPSLLEYEPSSDISWFRYGIPGCMKFRCKGCNAFLKKRVQLGPPFLCDSCRTNKI